MYKLVIVDDEYEIRTGLANYFPWGEIGFEVVTTLSNGKEAIDYLKENNVDVVLSDIKMPVMTGLELARDIKIHYPHIACLLLTGHAEFKYAQEAIRYQVKHYILKPLKYNQIIEVFSELREEFHTNRNTTKAQIVEVQEKEVIEEDQSYTITLIKNYVKENYQTASLEEVAKYLYMSTNYISKLFKEKTGENFSNYLQDMKMKEAIELMRDVKYKTYEISELVGYQNPKNFTRAFKKRYGKSPSEYRRGLC